MTTPTGRGGYRRPSSPAPVSGPGALSQRTDGGPGQPIRLPSGGKYGERAELEGLQQAAPLAATAGGDAVSPGVSPPSVTPFGAASERPDEPVTFGSPSGPGPGPEVLGLGTGMPEDIAALTAYLPVFEMMANQPGSSRASRNYLRSLKGYATGG